MLCLTARAGDSILIGDDIRVVVTRISGGQAKICIDAPKSIPIDREKVRISKEKGLKNA
jgi:carbon storage regulator